MNFYIILEDGNLTASSGPFTEEQMQTKFENFDPNNLPEMVFPFERVPVPTIGTFEVFEGTTFENVNGQWKDVHHIRPMTEVEKTEIRNRVREEFLEQNQAQLELYQMQNFVYNESTNTMVPPVPMPDDPDNLYGWDGIQWVVVQDRHNLPNNLLYINLKPELNDDIMRERLVAPYRRADAPHWGFHTKTKEWVQIDDVFNPPQDVYSQWGW